MSDSAAPSVHTALILAAGNGDRFRGDSCRSKLLAPLAGIPLLIRTLRSARQAGIAEAHVVLGYDAERVRALALSNGPDGLSLRFHLNPLWQQENGVSVLAAREAMEDRPFALMMGDHLFEPDLLRRLLRRARAPGEALLAVDAQEALPAIVVEATKVRMRGQLVTAIGKALDPFDALDTGLFVCDASLFGALVESCEAGDTSLSGGIARLSARGLVRGVDIGDARWCDIDTVADLRIAEGLLAPVRAS
jgi:choline kinase